ncbi:mitochondrial ribosomal protein L9 [Arctopsyche grandis]|uniref:mitochondrial ribosomal protein L9 n=1 Tax=Arctopsyche grandis TaxID=121162 RepID=UPI00406DA475
MLNFSNTFNHVKNIATSLINFQQTRNTFILRRRYKPLLNKERSPRKKLTHRYFIYDLVEDTNIKKQQSIKLILLQDVPEYGEKGQLVKVRPQNAYKCLLLPKLAIYASPENLQKYDVKTITTVSTVASKTFFYMSELLHQKVFYVSMNRTEPWVLEPWHLRVSFRKSHIVVPEHAIEMPPEKISGPDITLENKIFCVKIALSEGKKVEVRCRIEHFPVGLKDQDQLSLEPLFPEQAETISYLTEKHQKYLDEKKRNAKKIY